jgi:hypothetical protein
MSQGDDDDDFLQFFRIAMCRWRQSLKVARWKRFLIG